MLNLKDLKHRYKNDPLFKQKIIKAMFGLALVMGFLVFMIEKDNEEEQQPLKNNESAQKNNMDDYILSDTSQIIDDKNIIYEKDKNERFKNGSEVVLNTNNIPSEKDEKINDYLEHRKKTLKNMQSSNSNSYRRPYNPNPPVKQTYTRTTNPYIKEESINNSSQEETEIDEPKERTLEDIIREKNKKKKRISSNAFKVAIHQDQSISYGNSTVRLRLIEPITINDIEIGTAQFIYAKATFSKDVINLKVDNINYNNSIIPVNLVAYDYRTGNKGLSISQENLLGTVEDVAERQGNTELTKSGSIGGIVRDIFNGRNKKIKINLVNETYLFLKQEK